MVSIGFWSCAPNKEDAPVNSLKEVQAALAPTPKIFEIDPAEESLLNGDKGTSIYIPAEAFEFEDGTTPTGKVVIELKECYSLTDMIGENMSTTSRHSILETAGMIYINATANGKQLSVKRAKAFVVGFPKKGKTQEMDLFYDFAFNDTSSTWIPDYKMYEAEAIKKSKPDTASIGIESALDFQYPIEMTDDLFDYGFTLSSITATLYDLQLAGQKRTIVDYIHDPTTIADSITRKFYDNNWRVNYYMNIDKRGKMVNLRVYNHDGTDSYNAYALNAVKKYFESAPAFDLSIDTIKVDHYWDFVLGVMGYRQLNDVRFKKRFREKYSQFTNQAIQTMDKNVLDLYIFSATQMGWINCDRFWEIDDDRKTDFVITSHSSAEAKVQIVFKDINSIMNGVYQNGQFIFSNVPIGRQVKVIGISYANGKPTMAVAETAISKDSFKLDGFKEFSLSDLERELNN